MAKQHMPRVPAEVAKITTASLTRRPAPPTESIAERVAAASNRQAPERWTHDEPTAPMLTVHRNITSGAQRTVETGGADDRHYRALDGWVTTTLGTDCSVA